MAILRMMTMRTFISLMKLNNISLWARISVLKLDGEVIVPISLIHFMIIGQFNPTIHHKWGNLIHYNS